MRLYFLSYDNAFYWDRAGTLESKQAKAAGLHACAIFRDRRLTPDSIPVFNRFADTRFYRLFHKLCRRLRIPYVVDIDDLFWQLPAFSVDKAGRDHEYVKYLDRLVGGAQIVTTTTPRLQSELLRRYPGADVRVVENCPPPWCAPPRGVLIANTDNFKMGQDDVGWFARLLNFLHDSGMSLQFLGENDGILGATEAFQYHSDRSLSLREYLSYLSTREFRIGLIPVGRSEYADCKSAIKVMEFLSSGLEVVASDILPYRKFKEEFPSSKLTLVENSYEGWSSALKQILSRIPEAELAEGRAINEMLAAKRTAQFTQWLAVAKALESLPPHTARLRAADLLLRWYECMRTWMRWISGPVVRIQRLLQPS